MKWVYDNNHINVYPYTEKTSLMVKVKYVSMMCSPYTQATSNFKEKLEFV